MLQIKNKTPFAMSFALFPDEEGIDAIYPIIKATFGLNGQLSLAEKQMPLVEADEYSGDPGESSLIYTAELMAAKPATDVYMIADAYAPGGRPVEQVDVSLSIDNSRKTIRVFGDRKWENGFFGTKISAPIPFEKMPLIYDRAFGGRDITRKEDPVAYEFNPVGAGYFHPKGTNKADGAALPNLEDPENLIVRPQNQPHPVGFGPICANWQPRLQYVGTYDDAWMEKRAPYLPTDFDPRFYNAAAPELIFSPYLTGGEKVRINNASPDGYLEFDLPEIELAVDLKFESDIIPVSMNLDTVAIEPNQTRLTMIWRGKCNCDKKMLKMELATASIKGHDKSVKGM